MKTVIFPENAQDLLAILKGSGVEFHIITSGLSYEFSSDKFGVSKLSEDDIFKMIEDTFKKEFKIFIKFHSK